MSQFLLSVGTTLALSGVVFFFAYNWAELGRFAKFALLEGCIVLTVLGAWRLGNRMSGRALLATAMILVGPLLAVYGQTYQTGADPYELFLGWALITLPWVILARMPVLWMIFLLLLNIALILFWAQVVALAGEFGDSIPMYLALAMLNILPWIVWELLHRRGLSWVMVRWPPKLMAVSSFAILVMCMCVILLGVATDPVWYSVVAGVIAFSAAISSMYYFRFILPDLFIVAVTLASIMVVVTVGLGRFLFDVVDADIGGVLVLGMIVVGEVAAAGHWLRKEAHVTNARDRGETL